MRFNRLLFRAWFYFRTGYNVYIAFLIGFVSNIIVIYSLGIKPVIASGTEPGTLGSYFEILFPHLANFAVIAAIIAIPGCISIGMLHMRRTGAYEADASIGMEEHPYAYRAVPGKELEVFLPLWMITAQSLVDMLEEQKRMTPSQKATFEQAMGKAQALLEGRKVGSRK